MLHIQRRMIKMRQNWWLVFHKKEEYFWTLWSHQELASIPRWLLSFFWAPDEPDAAVLTCTAVTDILGCILQSSAVKWKHTCNAFRVCSINFAAWILFALTSTVPPCLISSPSWVLNVHSLCRIKTLNCEWTVGAEKPGAVLSDYANEQIKE